MNLIRKFIAVIGFLIFFWLLIPPIIKVDPATYAFIRLTASDRYTEAQKKEIQQHIKLGHDYYYGYVSKGFSGKIIPAACFCLIASVCLLAGDTERRKANKPPEAMAVERPPSNPPPPPAMPHL